MDYINRDGNLSGNDLNKTISLIDSLKFEYSQIQKRMEMHINLLHRLPYITIVFWGVLFGLFKYELIQEYGYILIQISCIVFYVNLASLEIYIKNDELYVIFLEKRLNHLIRKKTLGWHHCISLLDVNLNSKEIERTMKYYAGPILGFIFSFIVYCFTIFIIVNSNFGKNNEDNFFQKILDFIQKNRGIYAFFSIAVFLIITALLFEYKEKSMKKIINFVKDNFDLY